MAQQCDAQSLVTQAACLDCGIPSGMQNPIIIYLLCQIAGIAPDPNALMAAASCLNCNIPDGIARFIIIQLLCQIAAGGAVTPSLALTNTGLGVLSVSGWTGSQTVYFYISPDSGSTWLNFNSVTGTSPQLNPVEGGAEYFASLNANRTTTGPGDSNIVNVPL